MTPTHIACIRRLRFISIPHIESGGPAVDYDAPFGSPNALTDLAEISGLDDPAELAALYFDVMAALPTFAQTATLAPGSYHLEAEDVDIDFTAEHAKLIPAIRWAAIDANDLTDELTPGPDPSIPGGGWQIRSINFKRPFGDMTYFQLDMAEILGIPTAGELSPESEEHLNQVYDELHQALQVFVVHAQV